jgi:hypothetical protein
MPWGIGCAPKKQLRRRLLADLPPIGRQAKAIEVSKEIYVYRVPQIRL